jgi:methylmalonyl-CoA/ethylmalonyl-CoA epimerase
MKGPISPSQIDHIGIAVRSLDEALPLYTRVLGLELKGMEEVETEQVRVAFLQIGETNIELLEPASPESPIARFLEKKGEGIHHIALRVEAIEEKLEYLSQNGIRLIHEQPKQGAHGSRIAFLHPKSTQGVLYELCQPQARDE